MSQENLKQARKLSSDSIVLLKNNNILPLKKTNNKIALIGPYADNIAILGSWSMFSDKSNIKTLKEAFETNVGSNNIFYAKGSEILEEEINKILLADGGQIIYIDNEKEKQKQYITEALEVANKSDIIVLAIGQHYRQTGEACSRANIEISKIQKDLLNQLANLNKKIVTIIFNGRPLVLKDIADKSDALLEVWFPGTQGANAITDIVFGDVNPSGKLTMSFPQAVGQCPIYYNHYNTGRPHISNYRYVSCYQDIPTRSYYPFGYGLSYSKFEYSNLKINTNKIYSDSKIEVTVHVKNNSNINGKEIIQLYIQDLSASVVRPVKELKDFKKENFSPFEEKQIKFEITLDMLKFWNQKLEYKAESGKFRVYVGKNSVETLEENFEYIK